MTQFKEAPVKNQGKKVWHPLGKDLALLFVFMETFIYGRIFGTSLKGGSTYKLFLVVALSAKGLRSQLSDMID